MRGCSRAEVAHVVDGTNQLVNLCHPVEPLGFTCDLIGCVCWCWCSLISSPLKSPHCFLFRCSQCSCCSPLLSAASCPPLLPYSLLFLCYQVALYLVMPRSGLVRFLAENPRTLNWTFGPVQANFQTLNLGPVWFSNFELNLCLIW